MGEQRYFDFGRLYKAEDQNEVQKSFADACVLEGFDLGVSTDGLLLTISTGRAITPEGVIITNDNDREFTFDRTADAKKYTVSLVHTFSAVQNGRISTVELREVTDSGGSPIFSGTVNDLDGNLEGTVLGWVDYPGGSIDLSIDHIYNAARRQALPPTSNLTSSPSPEDGYVPVSVNAPYISSPGLVVDSDTLTPTQAVDGDGFPYTTWTNSTGSDKTILLTFVPTKPTYHRPKAIEHDLLISGLGDSVTQFQVTAPGYSGWSVSSTGDIAAGDKVINISGTTFPVAPNLVSGFKWIARLQVTLKPSSSMRLTYFRVKAGPIPLH